MVPETKLTRLETEKADRRIWLVRVPPYIAERWKEACSKRPGDSTAGEDDEGGSHVLGQIKIVPGGTQASQMFLQLPGTTGSSGIPQQYNLQAAPEIQPMHAISYDPPSKDGNLGAARVDGAVNQKFDVVPTAAAMGQGAQDQQYRQLARKRKEASMQRSRGVEVINDLREVKKLSRGNIEPLWAKQRATKPVEVHQVDKRRVRMDKDDLEQRLFTLFEGQPHWHFTQLQKETDQPSTWLKEVLNEVAFQNKRGPNKDLWELKKHFRTSTAAPAGAPAAPEGEVS